MSKLNIYETSWINLVFENRNKDYGAYHLRQENNKTSLFAFFLEILISNISLKFNESLRMFDILSYQYSQDIHYVFTGFALLFDKMERVCG